MSRVLPILFNSDMVRAILDGRKTVTRRLIKVPSYYPHFYKLHDNTDGRIAGQKNKLFAGFYKDEQIFYINGEKHVDAVYYKAPCKPGDTLYVRETWQYMYDLDGNDQIIEETGRYVYAADGLDVDTWVNPDGTHRFGIPWKPSIHMPKEAARIWLKVADVRMERLQDMRSEDGLNEGIQIDDFDLPGKSVVSNFKKVWNSTIKKSYLHVYGWDANPWVWRIKFERCEKPEGV